MILALQPDVAERLAKIERDEGIPPIEVAHQGISIWSQLRSDDERKRAGLAIMSIVVGRIGRNRQGDGGRHE